MKFISILGLSIMSVALLACSTATPTLKMNVTTAHYLNPNINGTAAPLVFEVYQLRTPYTFAEANFNELSSSPATLLGSDLVDKQTFEIQPGQQQNLSQILSSDTHYLGVVAVYRNINNSNWRYVIALPPKKSAYELAINLEAQGLNVKLGK